MIGHQIEGRTAGELEPVAVVEEFVALHLVVHRGRGGGMSRNISGLRRKSRGRRLSVTADSVAAFGVSLSRLRLPAREPKTMKRTLSYAGLAIAASLDPG